MNQVPVPMIPDISCLGTSIARYKTQALQVLQAFLHNTLDETKTDRRRCYKTA